MCIRDSGEFRTVEESERDLVSAIEHDPDLVARRIGRETSTFSRDDIVRFLDDRLSDTNEVERLAGIVEKGADLRIVSADTHSPLYAHAPQLALEDALRSHAREMAVAKDGRFDELALYGAIAKVEADLTREIRKKDKHAPAARLTDEQKVLVGNVDCTLSVAEGDAGTGKTTSMRVLKEYANRTGREIVGLTISQGAARRLEDESGIKSYNTAKGTALEALGDKIIPNGGIVVLDEAGMNDAKTAEQLLWICRERGATAVVLGDTKQLQPILAGSSLRDLRAAANEAGVYTTLTNNVRQRNVWHREAANEMADSLRAIPRTGRIDADKVRSAIEKLESHGCFKKADDVEKLIDQVATSYAVDRAMGVETKYMAASKEAQRYANEAIRRRMGLEGKGEQYATRYGTRECAVGDQIVFRENKTFKQRAGKSYRTVAEIANGDTAKVVETTKHGITVELPNGTKLFVDPKKYDALDHAYVSTYHAAQGASVERAVLILDRSASAELFYVGLSRSKGSVEIYYSAGNFEDVREIAEHVADRSSLKTTSAQFEELLAKSIGNDPLRRKIVEQIMESEDHPLRKKYDDIEAEKRQWKAFELAELRMAYAKRTEGITEDLPLGDKLAARKEIESEHRSAAREIIEKYRPVVFGRYVHDEVLARAESLANDIERTIQENERNRSLTHTRENADDRHRHIDLEADHEIER